MGWTPLDPQAATRRRYGAVTYPGGVATRGSSSDTAITANIQPLTGEQRQLLPEGARSMEGYRVATSTDLRSTDQHSQLPADEVVIDGDVFVVAWVKRWRFFAHYEAYVVRELET